MPFLRWIGGKQKLVQTLTKAVPADLNSLRYHEVFVGAGSLFLALAPKSAVLADVNPHLISCYKWVRRDPELVGRYLRDHKRADSESHYYRVRDQYNSSKSSAAQAARFIYLNKTCFNGIFRVNANGIFNVPYGHKRSPAIPKAADLCSVSTLLRTCELNVRSFEKSLQSVGAGDFVYLDPPYPPLNGTAYFTHYTSDRFGKTDQENLAKAVKKVSKRGAKFMMSNADTPLIRSLYNGFYFFELSVPRYVTCKSIKHKATEVIITNYLTENLRND